MSIFPRREARGLQILIYQKYYNLLKREIRFTLGFNTAKNTISKNDSNESC